MVGDNSVWFLIGEVLSMLANGVSSNRGGSFLAVPVNCSVWMDGESASEIREWNVLVKLEPSQPGIEWWLGIVKSELSGMRTRPK